MKEADEDRRHATRRRDQGDLQPSLTGRHKGRRSFEARREKGLQIVLRPLGALASTLLGAFGKFREEAVRTQELRCHNARVLLLPVDGPVERAHRLVIEHVRQ